MANKYFRIIRTSGPADGDVSRDHEQKLENYRKHAYADTNENTQKDRLSKLPEDYDKGYEIEIHSQSTTSYLFAHTVNILTVLCCSDESHEKNE